jgi:hypothetical protein
LQSLQLRRAPRRARSYEKLGEYRIVVKIVDIFGNDTSQAFAVEVK